MKCQILQNRLKFLKSAIISTAKISFDTFFDQFLRNEEKTGAG